MASTVNMARDDYRPFFLNIRLVFSAFWLAVRIIVYLLFLFSWLAPYVNPAQSSLFAIFGLALPFLFLLVNAMLLIGLLYNKQLSLAAMVCMLIGSINISQYVSVFPDKYIPSGDYQDIKVMSWNVMNFDMLKTGRTDVKDKMMALIRQEDPDVLVLQEFFSRRQSSTLRELLAIYPYFHLEQPEDENYPGKWGQVTFSKHPIINCQKVDFQQNTYNQCIASDIQIDDQVIRVYNMHMQSFNFDEEDHNAIQHFRQTYFPGSFPFSRFYDKMTHAYEKRCTQINCVASHIDNDHYYPIIICGDLNDTPNSYSYNIISRGLQDSFWISGQGLGTTYNGPIPGLRIDYILADQDFYIADHRTINEALSDHFPVVSTLKLPY